MTDQAYTQNYGNGESRYATCDDFLRVFKEDITRLFQLSFLLTGDHHKAEKCFLGSIDVCAKEKRVFREWARIWAKRAVVELAICELHPRHGYSSSSAVLPTVFSRNQQAIGHIAHFHTDAVLRLADFERFVFVLCVLEKFRDRECALLLGCSASEVREARTRAITELAGVERPDLAQSVRLHAVAKSFTAAKEAATTKIGADF